MKTNNLLIGLLAIWIAGGCSDDATGDGANQERGDTADTAQNSNTSSDSAVNNGGGDTSGGGDTNGGGGQSATLTGTLRDFRQSHPDFEYVVKSETGIVENSLGSDGKPVYAGGANGTATTTGPDNFNQWYNDVEGVNKSMPFTITLTNDGTGLYYYDNQEFFPLDGELFGNEGNPHNYHFTFELHTRFTYKGGEVFTFIGDDDLFVFINGELAIDLGGVHGKQTGSINLDDAANQLGITEGNSYTLDFFFAERHTVASTFRIETTITDLTGIILDK